LFSTQSFASKEFIFKIDTMTVETRRGDDTIALVAAMSQTVERLSRDIATALVVASAESPR
jgi:hypothetical protein